MSWWISLNGSDGDPLPVARHAEGGTYMLGGSGEADLNVTYNYGARFQFRWLNGRTGRDTTGELRAGVQLLGTDRDPDYWKPTAGNVGYAVSILLGWAEEHPTGVWRVN